MDNKNDRSRNKVKKRTNNKGDFDKICHNVINNKANPEVIY